MSLDPLIDALRNVRQPDVPMTKLATVTNGTATTVTVRFDGESLSSSRAYLKTFAGAQVGDRVIMLRIGSTWVAIARVTQPVETATPGDWNGWFASNTSYAQKSGNVVTVYVSFTASAVISANVPIQNLPVGWEVSAGKSAYFWGFDTASGAAVGLYMTGRFLQTVTVRPNGSGTIGVVTYQTA